MFVSQRVAAARPLATTAMHGRVEALKAGGEEVIDFSIAISHFPAPASVRACIAAAAGAAALPYTGVGGAPALRASLAHKVAQDNRIDAAPDEIIVTNGAKQALYEAMYVLTDPGDTVIVFKPHWPAYVATAELLNLKVVLVDLPEVLHAALLDSLPPARLIIINNPHNPTGKVYSAAELHVLGDWMGRTGCHAIVDESYEKLLFRGEHRSLASRPDWRALGVVTLFSASQSYAMMGWRSGFAVAPRHIVQAMETLQGPITAAASALTQAATGAAFASGEPTALVNDYRARRDMVVARFAPLPWIRMASPDSGPYLWGDVGALDCDTVAFAEDLLTEKRVAIMPGDALGCPGFIRLGFISDDVDTLMTGVARLIDFGNARAARKA
ncbi:MAG: aminotransferase class I/II-fold pyridoxal phosphate-dependent enzyme [Massilia sp.]